MNMPDAGYFFIHMKEFGSFSLIHIQEPPETIPEEFERLMPGNQDCIHSRNSKVFVENDPEWLAQLKKVEPDWFTELEERKERTIDGVSYRLIVQYVSI